MNASSPLDPNALKTALQDAWSSVHAGFVGGSVIQTVTPLVSRAGSLSLVVDRLFVYTPVAWIIICILIGDAGESRLDGLVCGEAQVRVDEQACWIDGACNLSGKGKFIAGSDKIEKRGRKDAAERVFEDGV